MSTTMPASGESREAALERAPRTTLLFVDDEETFRRLTARELERAGYAVTEAPNLAAAREQLGRQRFHLALLDIRLPDGSGLDLLAEIREQSPHTEVVLLTAYGTVQEAIHAMKHGAHDFLTKPCKFGELEAVLEKAQQKQSLVRGNAALMLDVARLGAGHDFVGRSPAVRELLTLVGRVAGTESTVLVRGESGVGKELVARAVHRYSARSHQPFVVVDCAALHENLLQSELFGHEKGAYTGAVRLKHGLFEVADRGTLFLDEIGELTPALQVKLLRVIETGTFRRVGGTADIHVQVRLVAATNRPLEQMIREGAFREDLYYRLNVFSLHIPPLRERREDIPLLVEHFVRRSTVVARRQVAVSDEAMGILTRYSWPGNVRELQNVIERALILCEGGVVGPEHLPLGVRIEPVAEEEEEEGRLLSLHELERRHMIRVLEACHGHRHKAAEILGISERNLYRKLKSLDHPEAVEVDSSED